MAIPKAVTTLATRANRFADEFPPDLPKFSDETLSRFQYLAPWQERMDEWYYEFRTVLRRSLSDLDNAIELADVKEASEAGISDLGDQVTGTQGDIADLLIRVGALESEIVGLKNRDNALDSEIDAILAALAGLQSQLSNHEVRITDLESTVYNPDVIQGTAGEIDVVYSPGFITIGIINPLLVTKGGTGSATALGAFNNLSPLTTRGDILVHNGTDNARVAHGTVGQYVGTDGTDTLFKTILSTEITNSTFVTSVTGTATRITSSGGLTPAIDLVTTAVTPNTYGSASQVGQFTVDAYGRLTSAASVSIAIDAAAVTSGTLGISRGGTGQTTAVLAFNALAPTTTRGDIITRNATNNIRLGLGGVTDYVGSDGTDLVWKPLPAAGEVNTASNVGTVGTGVFKQKTGVNLEFYKLNPANSKLTIAVVSSDRIDFTIDSNAVVAASTDSRLSDARAWIGGDEPSYARIMGTGTPGAGSGLELHWDGSVATIFPYNRTAGTYQNLAIDALNTSLNISGVSLGYVATTGIRTSGGQSLGWSVSTVGANGALAMALYKGISDDAFALQGRTAGFPAFKRVGAAIQVTLADDTGYAGFSSLYDRYGTGSPEGVVTAPIGTTFHRLDGGAGTGTYAKESGTGNTGWVVMSTAGGGTVTSVSGTAGRISSTGGTTPILDLVTTAVTPATYGSASIVPVLTVDAYGRLTGVTNTAIALSAAAITSGTLVVGRGGTGAVTLTGMLQGNGTAAVDAITGTTNYLTKWAASAPYLINSLVFDNGTNVGINTAGPDRRLDVLDTNPQLRLTYTDGTVYSDIFTDSGGVLTFVATGNRVVQRNGTTAQNWDLYGTYTDATTYERLMISHAGTSAGITINSEAGSVGGTARHMQFVAPSGANFGFAPNTSIAPAAKFHIRNGGTVLPAINAGTVLLLSVTSLASSGAQFSLISGNTGGAQMFFGDTDREDSGGIFYNNADDTFRIGTVTNAERIRIGLGGLAIGATSFGASATRSLIMLSGTAPAGNVTDCFQFYSADQVAGNACPFFRTENGAIVKLFQDTGWTLPTGTASKAGFAASTATLTQLAQTLKAIMDHLMTGCALFAT